MTLPMHSNSNLFRILTKLITTSSIQRSFHSSRDPFTNKLSHYLYRSKLIDSIRIALRSDPSALPRALSDRHVDRFVIANALRCAPSPDSALSLAESLEAIPHFSHGQNTVHALATVLAKSRRGVELKELINAVNLGRFPNVTLTFMDLMCWFAAAGDLESVLQVWSDYRQTSAKGVCAESYNIVMHLYAQMGNDSEAVNTFYQMINEGRIPNCRTYKIMIEHLVNSGMLGPAREIFGLLPLMRIRRTSNLYLVLVEGFVGVKRFDIVKDLLEEMRSDGILPGRAMRLSLERMHDAGFVKESEVFLKEMVPDGRIKSVEYCVGSGGDEDDDDDEDEEDKDEEGVQLKPWLDPRSLARALAKWGAEEVAALEGANFVWTSRLVCKILRNFKLPETAWKFFCWVALQPGFTHDIYTVQRTITILARHGQAELVDRLMLKIRAEGMRLPFSTIRLLIDFYSLSKQADAALKVFREDRDLCGPISNFNMMVLYSSLLRTLTKCRRNSDTMNVLEEMISQGINPDAQTFSGLMHHFAASGDIKTVQKLFAMVRQCEIEPDGYMFKVLVQAYCKCDRAALALRAFEDLRSLDLVPDAATKDLLVKSLWKEGKRREAASVEESCREVSNVLPLRLQGHIWTVSSADITRVFEIYSNSFTSNDINLDKTVY